MSSPEDFERRLRALETWANREALKHGTLGFIAERMIAEQLAAMPPDACERILADLTNPYRFTMTMTGDRAGDDRFKREVGEAATRHIDEVVESIRKRVEELRTERTS